jgi:hypothetical protein
LKRGSYEDAKFLCETPTGVSPKTCFARGEHLTVEGLQSIVNIRASLNKGLSPALLEAFPNSVPVSRFISTCAGNSLISSAKLHPQWVAGFISGEGSFMVEIRKSKALKAGGRVALMFRFNQHIRDEYLIRSFVDYEPFSRLAAPEGLDVVIIILIKIMQNINVKFFNIIMI